MQKKLVIEIVVDEKTDILIKQRFSSILLCIYEDVKEGMLYGLGTIGTNEEPGKYSFQITEKKKKKELQKSPNLSSFETFYSTFPSSAKFEYKGKKFTSARVLKANKPVCLNLYEKLLLEDSVTPETLLKCLQVQLETIKIESYKKNKNLLEYLNGCEVWLRQKKYIAFLEEEMPVDDSKTPVQDNNIYI